MNPVQEQPAQPVISARKNFSGIFRYSAVELLAAIGLFILTSPFIESLPNGDLIEALLLSLVMISALLAVGGQRRNLVIGLVLLTPAFIGKWLNHLLPDLIHPAFF